MSAVHRRRFAVLASALVAIGLLSAALPARAAFPDKPIRLVLGFPPGSATDVAARIIGSKMSEILGQQIVVDNKPGATTNIAGQQVARAAPDGYTLFMAGNTNAVNPSLLKNVPFDMARDFTPVGLAGSVASILVVNPSLGVHSVPELTALAKAQPGKIFFASSGNGTMSHLSGELYGMSTGTKLTHVAYKGSAQAVTDLLAGTVPVMFAPASTVLPFIKGGKLIALATTGAQRSRIAPDLPTVAEAGVKGYDTRIWWGFVAPAGTPAPVIKTLADALDKAIDAPEVKEQLLNQGIEPFKGDGKAFAAHMAAETKKWTQVVNTAGITPD
ncbi:MAG: tripartite tricarboxylate transporter substrate binding protein [Pseudomonadota bacterium]